MSVNSYGGAILQAEHQHVENKVGGTIEVLICCYLNNTKGNSLLSFSVPASQPFSLALSSIPWTMSAPQQSC